MDKFEDDHWLYQRRGGYNMPPRPFEHIREPRPVTGRVGRGGTNHQPVEIYPVPPSTTQSPPQTLAEFLTQTIAAIPPALPPSSGPVTVSVALTAPVSAPAPVSVPVPIPISPTAASPPSLFSSPKSSVSLNVSITVTSEEQLPEEQLPPYSPPRWSSQQSTQQPSRYPPTLEEFLADIERRRSQSVSQGRHSDPFSFASHLRETGQEGDPIDVIQAREMALATTDINARVKPRMVWNF
jgi:hypothetical protein